MNDDFVDRFAETASEQTGQLIDNAAEKVQWARQKATEFLEHADALEERAEAYRHLAALMLLEAQGYADSISDLLTAEFPTNEDIDLSEDRG